MDNTLLIRNINTKFANILQMKKPELQNKPIFQFLPEIRVFSFNKPHGFQMIDRDNGQSLSLDLIRTKSDNNTEFLVFCRDRTKRQQLTGQIDQLNEQVSLYNKMFNVLYDGIFITDKQGTTIYVNDSFLRLSGLKKDKIIGKSVYYLRENNIVPNSCAARVLETNAPATTMNDYYGGTNCLVSGTPVFVNDELARVICIVRDVSELDSLRGNLANATSLTLGYKHQLKEIELQTTNTHVMNTRSKLMNNIYNKAIKIASVDSPVLILGETGVGKDHLAKFIHDASDRDIDGCFVKINCGAIPEPLLESELFGYEPGAFTGAQRQGKAGLFEIAGNGTVYLDEIGDMPLHLQVKLLNALQDKLIYRVGGTKTISIQARIIAATNSDLEKLIAEGKFRRDLYYRLNVIDIKMPPLRYRSDDIIPLAMHFLDQYNQQFNRTHYFSPRTLDLFLSYDWPGNIREMKNTVERLVVMSEQDCIEPIGLEESFLNNLKYTDSSDQFPFHIPNASAKLNLKQKVENYESTLIKEAIEIHDTLKEAAETLEIDLSTLVRKRQKYQLPGKK